MNNKYRPAVTGLAANAATFHGASCDLAPVSFFFGKNGTGKSTLASILGSGVGALWNPDQNPEDFEVLVYNRDYVEKNLQPFAGLPGVFTVDEVNAAVQNEIDAAAERLRALRVERDQARNARDGAEQQQEALRQQTEEVIWQAGRGLRDPFKKALKGSLTKAAYFQRVLATDAGTPHDQEALDTLYNTAFDDEAAAHPQLSPAAPVLPKSDLLGQAIISTSDSSYTRFMKALGATDWVRHGHAEYQEAADGACPYCQQRLPDEVQQEISASFDSAYQEDIAALRAFIEDYKEKARVLWSTPKSHQLEDPLGTLDFVEYDAKVDLLQARLRANVAALDEKLASPSKAVTLEETAHLVDEINHLVESFNAATAEHNHIVASREDQQKLCTQMVWEASADRLEEKVTAYRNEVAKATRRVREADAAFNQAETDIATLEKTIASLHSQTVNTGETVTKINALLKASGFQGFLMRQRPDQPNVYEVARDDGSIAEHLSEGERNFIAFLYFYHQLRGSVNREGNSKQRIVVIDDPVSSMDSSSLFIVASLVRNLVDACAHNWSPYEDATDIAQVVILTHNTYFFKEASYNRVTDYKLASYFLVEKLDNHSSIRACTRRRSDAPSLMENYTPVANSYTALWAEYFEIQSSTPLLNVMRRILEHYFIQMCGHDGSDLQQAILVDNRDKFVVTNEDGTEDLSAFHQAQSILSYINHQTTGLGDDIYHVDGAADPTLCRETFELIFTHMGQSQHYEMMSRAHGHGKRPSQ